jgi:hypothetical protein
MQINSTINEINEIRANYLESVAQLDKIASFGALREQALTKEWAFARSTARLPNVANPASATFASAIVGSSNNGKTTLLSEMFPSLAERGWLVTEVHDTTSQALRISFAPDASVQNVHLHSWSLDQIRKLTDGARRDNVADNVVTDDSSKDQITIDGTAARFTDKDRFTFALQQTLRPLPLSVLDITKRAEGDRAFITALTVKVPADRVQRGPLLSINDHDYEPLALRAIVKEVDLHDPFTQIIRWAKERSDQALGLVFIDTPGINVGFSINDEVLRHVLKRKNQQIVIELMRRDELDILIHLVMPHNNSTFSELLKALAEDGSADQVADIEERLILAVHGFNKFLTDPNLVNKYSTGDHFKIAIDENNLKKMSELGRVQPARTCFLDNATYHLGHYQSFYEKHASTLQSWCDPASASWKALERMNLMSLNQFRENIDAICDPADRGQGFLIRQVLDLIEANGAKLKVRKHLVRTRLREAMGRLLDGLRRYYTPEGKLNFQVIRDAVRLCLENARLKFDDPDSIEEFVAAHDLDSKIDGFLPPHDGTAPETWVRDASRKAAQLILTVLARVNRNANLSQQSLEFFKQYFNERFRSWERTWGYRTATYPAPTQQNHSSVELVKHTLKLYFREILYQLPTGAMESPHQNTHQDAKDQAEMQAVLKKLDDNLTHLESLCQRHGV